MSLEKLYSSAQSGRADDALVKVVMPGLRLIWLWIPKNAGGSISRSLVQTHGEDAIPCDLPLERLWRLNGDMRDFRIVALKRNPYTRIASCWLNKIAEPRSFNPRYLRKYRGLTAGMSFPDFAEWLNTPEGSDQDADPHWRSQYLMLERTTEILAFEDLPGAVSILGIPPSSLPHRNPHAQMAEHAGLEARALLDWYDERAFGHVSRRYARDLEVLGYGVPEGPDPMSGSVGSCAAPTDGMGAAGAERDGQRRAGEQA